MLKIRRASCRGRPFQSETLFPTTPHPALSSIPQLGSELKATTPSLDHSQFQVGRRPSFPLLQVCLSQTALSSNQSRTHRDHTTPRTSTQPRDSTERSNPSFLNSESLREGRSVESHCRTPGTPEEDGIEPQTKMEPNSEIPHGPRRLKKPYNVFSNLSFMSFFFLFFFFD